MLTPIRLVTVVLVSLLMALPARAATTIFASSVYSQSGVVNATSALGGANGAAAQIGAGGELVLGFNHALTGAGLSTALLPLAGAPAFNVLAVSVGEVIGGVAVFSGEFVLVDMGSGGALNANLSALCSSVSATGCSLVKFRNAASFNSTGALLDGVSGVSNAPEPAVWALMILGFGGAAWRLKRTRKPAQAMDGWGAAKASFA